MRVKFPKSQQRKFLDLVKINTLSPSLRALLQYGFDTSYDSLKNYYNERRLMPKALFNNLCYAAKINSENLEVSYVQDNWGKIKGGKLGKRKALK